VIAVAALASASVVERRTADDIVIDIPDVQDAKFSTLTISAIKNVLTLHSPNIEFSSGMAKGTFADMDLEVAHYTLSGNFEKIINLKGDGTISLVMYPTMTVAYTPESDHDACPKAGSTVSAYTFAMDKAEMKITGLYADQFHMDDIADAYVSQHASKIGQAIEKYLNTPEEMAKLNPRVLAILSKFC